MIIMPRVEVGTAGPGDTNPSGGVQPGAFKALLRDLEKDYWQNRPDGMAVTTDDVSDPMAEEVLRSSVPKPEQAPVGPDVIAVAGKPLRPGVAAFLQLRHDVHHVLAGPRQEDRVGDRLVIGGTIAGEPVDQKQESLGLVDTTSDKAKRQAVPVAAEQQYQLARLHVYRVADGVGITYRDARLIDTESAAMVSELRSRLRASSVVVKEIYINARRVELKGS